MSAHNDRQAEMALLRRDALAELVAGGVRVMAAGRKLGFPTETTKKMWARIRRDLGEQAR